METEKFQKQNSIIFRDQLEFDRLIENHFTIIDGCDHYFEDQTINFASDKYSLIVPDLDQFNLISDVKLSEIKEEPIEYKSIQNSDIVIIEGEVENSSRSFILRFQNINGRIEKIWECITCRRTFKHQYILFRHLAVHSDVRKFTCSECGKAFRRFLTLNQHLATHSQERPHICGICEKAFNRVSTLISHKKTHLLEKPFQCHICSKSFHQKGNLTNHIYIHTNERPYRCLDCNKGFNQMSNLVCHKKKAHSDASVSLWQCDRCDEAFPKRTQLRAHEINVHQVKRTIKHSARRSVAIPDSTTKFDAPVLQSGIFLPIIETSAMKVVQEKNETPFAVLHLLKGVPLLVRVIACANQSLLRPATKADFDVLKQKSETVSLPLVAAIHQVLSPDGQSIFKVSAPRDIYKFASNQSLKLQYENGGQKVSESMPPIEVDSSSNVFEKVSSNSVLKLDGDKKSISSSCIVPAKKVKVEAIPQPTDPINLFGNENLSEEEMNRIFANITAGEPLSPKSHQETDPMLNAGSDIIMKNEENSNMSIVNQIAEVIQAEGLEADYEKIQQFFTGSGVM